MLNKYAMVNQQHINYVQLIKMIVYTFHLVKKL